MNKRVVFTIILLSISIKSFSQGCSDAGFCTIGSLNPSMPSDTSFKHVAKLSFSYGIGEQSTTHIHLIPELDFSFFKNNTLQIKVPYISVNGNLGSNSGVGDVAFSISQKIIAKEYSHLSITVGTKLPTGTTNKELENFSFPMPYQTGLGTFDLILGASYQYRKWKFSTGYQMVLSNDNKNNFLHSVNNSSDANKYFESNYLVRGDDALLRVERGFVSRKIKFSAGLLVPRGSVLVWHGSLWHGGGANTTAERRVGIAMNYCAGYIRQQENQQLGIPRSVAAGFEQRLQQLCGYSVYFGLIGHIDKHDPIQLLRGEGGLNMVWDQV